MVILFAFRSILHSAPPFSVPWKAVLSRIPLLCSLALWLPSDSATGRHQQETGRWKGREVRPLSTWPCFWPQSVASSCNYSSPRAVPLPQLQFSACFQCHHSPPPPLFQALGWYCFPLPSPVVVASATTLLDPAVASRSSLFVTKFLRKPFCWDSFSSQDLDYNRLLPH